MTHEDTRNRANANLKDYQIAQLRNVALKAARDQINLAIARDLDVRSVIRPMQVELTKFQNSSLEDLQDMLGRFKEIMGAIDES